MRGGILHAGNVHARALVAQDVHRRLGNRLAQLLVLREGHVNRVLLRVPLPVAHHATELRHGMEQPRVHRKAVQQQVAHHPVEELHRMLQRLRAQPCVLLLHLVDNVRQRQAPGGFQLQYLVFLVVGRDRIVHEPTFQCMFHLSFILSCL